MPQLKPDCAGDGDDDAERLEADVAEAKARHAPDSPWTPESAALYSQAVLQGAFILAKAKHGPKVAADCLDHLTRYFETLLPIGGAEHPAR